MVAGPPGDNGVRAQEFVALDHKQELEHAIALLRGTVEPTARVQILRLEDAALIIAQVGKTFVALTHTYAHRNCVADTFYLCVIMFVEK